MVWLWGGCFVWCNERKGESMINENNIVAITEEINAVCPIHGINSNGVIFFKDEATEAQRAAAVAIIGKYYP